jgi:hypothetical protein
MTSPLALSEIGKKRKNIIERVQSRLTDMGFLVQDETTSWRSNETNVDIFHFDLLNASACRKWRVPAGSFCLDPKCFFPALPSLSSEWEACDSSTSLSSPVPHIRAQLRFAVFKGIYQHDCLSNTVYSISKDQSIIEYIVDDLYRVIDMKLINFWSTYRNPHRLLQSLKEDDDVLGRDKEGLIQIGDKGSHIRLFYLGFTALWVEEYDLAISALSECRQSSKWRVNVPGAFDGQPVLQCIDKGLARARDGVAAIRR